MKPSTLSEDMDCIHISDYDPDGKTIKTEEYISMSVVQLRTDHDVLPHPPYQFCTPTSRSIMASKKDMNSAPFIPYPEDSTFPKEEYLKPFDTVQWLEHLDPEDQVIQYETVRRLHIEHGCSAETINNMIMDNPGFAALRLPNGKGLLWEMDHRDLPPVIWGDGLPASRKPRLPSNFAGDIRPDNNIFDDVNHALNWFCPNLNCITDQCGLHVSPDMIDYSTSRVTPKEPLVTSVDLLQLEAGIDCGAACFQLIEPGHMEDVDDSVDLAGPELSFLNGFFKINPDALPCDMANIFNIPCREIFLHRQKLLPDREIPDHPSRVHHNDPDLQLFYTSPCAHPGPCSNETRCACAKPGVFCERNCRCSATCPNRWRGCNGTCGKTATHKCAAVFDEDTGEELSAICKCRKYNRECDPELCTRCDARNKKLHFPQTRGSARVRRPARAARCQNMVIQRGEFKRIEIRASKYGLGAFAGQTLKKGDAIGEYVGELVPAKAKHQVEIHQHAGLNYHFQLQGIKYSIDAQWVGNLTRFLNDSEHGPNPIAANCWPQQRTVNGEERLILVAVKSVKKGKELFISYGEEDYWQKLSGDVDEED
ncbi:hypothetical protein C8R46DRAFT_456388 [Mycena filopes]|nr:hypothetical protein C8R46DRAFT_456388 [Mycena filopes]